jgi:tetratricopeptide (TPR) repeat protein
MSRAGRLFLLIFSFLILAQGAVFARGQAAVDLSYADKLISEQKYNEAMSYLQKYMGVAQYSEYFDEAQKRIERIIRLQSERNKVTAELIDLIQKDPEGKDPKNAARIAVLLQKLQLIEKYPNQTQKEYRQNLLSLMLFKVNQQKYEQIFSEGNRLLDAKESVKAAALFKSGFTLYRDEFNRQYEGTLIQSQTEKTVSDLNAAMDAWEAARKKFIESGDRLIAAAGRQAAGYQSALSEEDPTIRSFLATRNEISRAGQNLENQFLVLKKATPTLTDASFLSFAYHFALGQSPGKTMDGLLGTVDRDWFGLFSQLGKIDLKAQEADYAKLESIVASADPKAATAFPSTVAELRARAQQASRALAYRDLALAQDTDEYLKPFRAKLQADTATLKEKSAFILDYAALVERESSLAALQSPKAESDAKVMETARLQSAAIRQGAEGILRDESSVSKSYADYLKSGGKDGVDLSGYGAYGERLRSRLGTRLASLQKDETRLAVAAATLEYSQIQATVEICQKNLDEAEKYLAGAPSTDPDLNGLVLKYPKQGIAVSAAAQGQASAGVKALDDILKKYAQLDDFVKNSDDYKAFQANASASREGFAQLLSKANSLTASATAQARDADAAVLEAQQLLSEAKKYVAQSKYDQALDRIDRASARYGDALSIQWDAALNQESAKSITSLKDSITSSRQAKVVKDYRALITRGSDAYYQTNFDEAESAFTQAQTLWRTAYPDDDPEVLDWLARVRTAMSVNSGRTIPPTAPRYRDFSQLLSRAQEYYDKGSSFLTKGRKTEAINYLSNAGEIIKKIKDEFPLNQEASILSLKIEQLVDRDKFPQSFKQHYEAALVKLNPATPTSWNEGYADLLDLRAINPGYRGLADEIVKAEYRLGIRIPPADPQRKKDSQKKVADARSLVEANNPSFLPTILSLLNDAIKLDPENSTAIRLKDQVQLGSARSGATDASALSSLDEKVYYSALEKYQNGEAQEARELLKPLANNPKYKNNSKVQKLWERLQ